MKLTIDAGPPPPGGLLAAIRAMRAGNPAGRAGFNSVGGWQSRSEMLGQGLLGTAMAARLAEIAPAARGSCWASVLPPGASYGRHRHPHTERVAVWFLTGGADLHISDRSVTPEPGLLVMFLGETEHWTDATEVERISMAANLT